MVKNIFTKSVLDNMRLNSREAVSARIRLKSYPVRIFIETTQKCNLQCMTCTTFKRNLKDDMPLDLFYRIEKEFFDRVAEVNFFLAGEPFLARNFTQMISVCNRYSFLPKVFTNGVCLSDEIAYSLVRNGFFVNFSFDAAEASLFENIRKGAKFSVVVENILKLQNVSTKVGGSGRFHLRLACTLGLHNISQAPEIVKFAHANNIRDIMFGSYDGPSNPTNMLSSDPILALKYINCAIELADKRGVRFSFPKSIGRFVLQRNNNWLDFSLPIDRYVPFALEAFNPYGGDCFYPWMQTLIRTSGEIVSCCQRKHHMGNMYDDDFFTIWNDHQYQSLRKQKKYYQCKGLTCNLSYYSVLIPTYPRKGKGGDWSLFNRVKWSILRFMKAVNIKVPSLLLKIFK
jgi:MoaA/NifB/PqqE/SkfB family radical SAM enzyme